METEIIEIKPSGAIYFDEYPMSKIFAEVLICNRSNEKIVFRVNDIFVSKKTRIYLKFLD